MTERPKRHIKDAIYETYLGRLQRGEITHEDRLIDLAIAEEFAVSRMPVRDALMRLTHEGYLESTTRGFALPNLSQSQILEIFELRRLLEPRAAALATSELTDADLDALAAAVARSERTLETGDVEALYAASEDIRRIWIMGVPNTALRETILRYIAQIQCVRLATLHDSASHQTLVDFHRQMVSAFTTRNGAQVELLFLRFVLAGEESYRRLHPVS
ncbi:MULTISPECIES: GntR family transcriptional regulator [unclassified Salipiger]|uniref:GntR family transcriptional regulator n=1 Tax=unclassified Salipiger TaxID=2640570 RepID=UPI0013B847AA|nr:MULTISPECIES: GntR family transcriptional regulator [unclassified Salipiger]NDV48876.1 GntR family transcriptional regulator [Salipiger sp. PrR003]NDW31139.1 GntR family transcriptional regulator [Salipiger sp. PrR007]